MKQEHYSFVAVVLFLVLAAFFYVTHSILSPILVGLVLLFLLSGLKSFPLARRLWIVVAVILIVWFVIRAQAMFFPFIVAFALAYIFDPVADFFEARKVPRTLITLVLLILTFGLVFLVGLILIPSMVEEIQELIGRIPGMANQFSLFVKESLPEALEKLKINPEKFQQALMLEVPERFQAVLANILKGISGIGALLNHVFNIILIPILTFYLLKDFDRIKEWIFDLIPKKHRSACYFYAWRMNRILGGYLRGQFIACTIVAILTGTGLALFGIPFAIILGFMTGILNIIPIIGFYASFGLVMLSAFFTPNVIPSMLKIAAVFLSVQAIDSYVITPRIVGGRVGLHPVAVIIAVLVFARFLGVWGLIVGVPAAALIKFLLDEWHRREKWKEMMHEKSVTDDQPC